MCACAQHRRLPHTVDCLRVPIRVVTQKHHFPAVPSFNENSDKLLSVMILSSASHSFECHVTRRNSICCLHCILHNNVFDSRNECNDFIHDCQNSASSISIFTAGLIGVQQLCNCQIPANHCDAKIFIKQAIVYIHRYIVDPAESFSIFLGVNHIAKESGEMQRYKMSQPNKFAIDGDWLRNKNNRLTKNPQR